MSAISNLLAFKEHWEMPTLVLVDVHNDHSPGLGPEPEREDFMAALEKCRIALTCARRQGFPVAFVRHVSPPRSFLANRVYPSWVEDIRPRRTDMVFERAFPSCYASNEFAQMARLSKGMVLAGLFGETACLATLMEGYGRNHFFTYLADASVSRARGRVVADQMHRSVVEIAGLYSDVTTTEAWAERMSRKIEATG